MPIYIYECPKCKKSLELEQKISEKVAPMCCDENCNVEMNCVPARSSFSLKGSGWYKDGYTSKKE